MMKIKILKIIFLSLFLFFVGKAYDIGKFTLENEGRGHPNEDKFCVEDKKEEQEKPYDFFIGIFDGHAGFNVSTVLSEQVVPKFEECLQENGGNVSDALGQTFNFLDEQTKIGDSGSTAVVCCLKDGFLYVAWVGDSRMTFYRTDGCLSTVEPEFGTLEANRIISAGGIIDCYWVLNLPDQFYLNLIKRFLPGDKCFWFYTDSLEQITDENRCQLLDSCFHRGVEVELPFVSGVSVVNLLCSSGVKDWCVIREISQGNDSLAMSRSFGDSDFKRIGVHAVPDIYTWQLQQGDKFLVLATDGLWDAMSNEEVGRFVGWCRDVGQNAQLISETLCRRARELGSSDDITVFVVLFDESDFGG
jgi:serine/threonine protein phosphatase PrpC